MASFVRLAPCRLAELALAYGGEVVGGDPGPLGRFVPLDVARVADLAPLTAARFVGDAVAALTRGAALLVQAELYDAVRARAPSGATLWVHPFAPWAMAKVLGRHADASRDPATVGEGGSLGANATLEPRVVVGDRVMVGASCVIGSPGFGWAVGPGGERVHLPQLGGVLIEDDVFLGPLVTVDAGTLGPTIIRRGVKLDAHVHVGHNVEIGEGTVVAAQSGFAGSVKVGRRVLVGGQVGVADHVTIGDDARIAAKSGVIGDVPAGATVAGYPAVPRVRWLRGLAGLYRRRKESTE